MRVTLKNFFIPHVERRTRTFFEPSVCAIIPTYKPGGTALRLVEDLLRYNPRLRVCVVDDCTPPGHVPSAVALARLREMSGRVTVLRTPTNKLKAGALNLAIAHLSRTKSPPAPAVILTLDDDVVVGPTTIRRMVEELLARRNLGAVCSRCLVLNKNKNVLTRLQGLEYVGYNAIRLADQGFAGGPLVMHGMLTAFRGRALRQAGPFAEAHLIEDYEMTTRLKSLGWEVKAVLDAPAWTIVPERLGDLWRQRTRWSYGGVTVVLGAPTFKAVLQDIIGHGVFISTLVVIGLLLLTQGSGPVPPLFVQVVVGLSLLQLGAWYGLQVWLMRWYPERDAYDWALRLTLIPELLYSNFLTVALVGSYVFLGFSTLTRRFVARGGTAARAVAAVSAGFKMIGYSGGWGTRNR